MCLAGQEVGLPNRTHITVYHAERYEPELLPRLIDVRSITSLDGQPLHGKSTIQ